MLAAEATREPSKWKLERKKQWKNHAAGAAGGTAADVPFHIMNLIVLKSRSPLASLMNWRYRMAFGYLISVYTMQLTCYTLLPEPLVRFCAAPRRDAPTRTVVDEGTPVCVHSLVAVLPV